MAGIGNNAAVNKMDRDKLDGWCEKGILGLVLAILVIGPLALGGAGAWQFLLLQGLTVLAVLLWGVRLWTSQRPQLLWPPICWAVLAFVGYAIIRYLQSDIEYVARLELIKILTYAFLFFVILNNLHRQESMQIISFTLLFLGMAISAYAIFQFATKSSRIWNVTVDSVYRGRAGGTFYNPNNLAGFLEMLLPLGLCYVLAGRLSHIAKIFLGYASVVMIAGVAVTLSRGGWITTGLELILLCGVLLCHRNYRIQALVLLLLVGGVACFLAPRMEPARARFQKIYSSGKADDLRLSIWRPAVLMWEDNLWLGVGPGQFDYRFRQYRPLDVQLRPDRAHNEYLNTLADYGLLGAALVAAAWVLLYVGVAKAWKFVRAEPDDFARKKSNKFAFMLGTSLGLLGILLHAVLDFHLHVPANAILAVALMALLSSQGRFATERYWFTAKLWTKCAVTTIILAGAAYLGFTGWRGGRECFYLEQANRQPNFSYARIERLKQASKIEPMNSETTYDIAECYRTKSWVGSAESVELARQAMEWYRRGMVLDPHDGYNWLGYGLCLDWIGLPETGSQENSTSYFQRADELDPNGYFTSAKIAWHYVQTGDYAAARTWFERSRRLEWVGNDVADNYLKIVEQRLGEAAMALYPR
ncbi:MAG: O-antigen polymerase [Pedosphaera sp.]|nr:O-antigen polymerase [Pedosphaera sp.]